MSGGYWRVVVAAGLAAWLCTSVVEARPARHASNNSPQGSPAPTIITFYTGQPDENPPEQPKRGRNSKFDLEVRSVEAAENSTRWTMYGVYVGAIGGVAVIVTLGISIWQSDLSRRAYIAANRPRIKIEQIYGIEFLPNAPLKMRVISYNIGQSVAYMQRMEIRISCKKEGIRTEVSYAERTLTERVKPGDMIDHNNISLRSNIPAMLHREVLEGNAKLYFEIILHYRDQNRISRSTGEMRAYSIERHVFEKTVEPEVAHHTFEH